MDKTFHEVQVKVAKRLIHSDRHRVRRKSLAPEIATCNSKNHDLSRLMVKNEILFKNLEGKVSSIEQEQRRIRNEFLRSEKALSVSARKTSLPHLQQKKFGSFMNDRRWSIPAKQPRRSSLMKDEPSNSSTNALVQRWLKRFDDEVNEKYEKNTHLDTSS